MSTPALRGLDQLEAVLPDEAITILRDAGDNSASTLPLAEIALALGGLEYPVGDFSEYREHLRRLRDDVGLYARAEPARTGTAEGRAAILNDVIRGLHRYDGDRENYDDLRNACLPAVIDRRKGMPIALCLIYIDAARSQGWDAVGIGFPGHFLLRLEHAGARAIVDPFNGGALLGAPDLRALVKTFLGPDAELMGEHHEPCDDRSILLRLQNNLKLRLLRQRSLDRVALVLESMLRIAPGEVRLWQETGLVHARLGNVDAAIDALEIFLEHDTDAASRSQARAVLRELRDKQEQSR